MVAETRKISIAILFKDSIKNVIEAKLVHLIKVTVCEGKGVEADPVRHVTYYVEPEGRIAARVDEWESEELLKARAGAKP